MHSLQTVRWGLSARLLLGAPLTVRRARGFVPAADCKSSRFADPSVVSSAKLHALEGRAGPHEAESHRKKYGRPEFAIGDTARKDDMAKVAGLYTTMCT